MSLRLIYGRAGAGKSYRTMMEIKQEIEAGGSNPLILLIPEQFTLQAEKNLVDIVGPGIIRAEVLSFRRMAHRVFNEVGGVVRPHINGSGKAMLLYNTIDKIKDDLKIFSKAVDQQGFINTIAETITEFKRYNITPEILLKTEETMAEGLFRDKLRDIALIYHSFEQELHINYIDAEDDLTILAEKLDKSSMLEGAEIWIDEFSGFTPQEYKVIEKLLFKARRVNINLCTQDFEPSNTVEISDVFWSTKSCSQKLLKIARENSIALDPTLEIPGDIPYRLKDSQELLHIEKNYFAFPYNRFLENTKDIGVFSAANIYSEIEDTARDILRLTRESNTRFRDIAVVVRDLAGYERLIEVIFRQYGIPFFIDNKRPITSHPIVLLILSAMEITLKNWSYESVFRYLKTGLTNISSEDIDLIENYVLAKGIRGSRWTREDGWKDKDDVQILDTLNDIRLRIVKPLAQFAERIKRDKRADEICSSLYYFLCDIGLPDRIETLIEYFKESGQIDQAKEYSQIWNIIIDLLDQTVEVMGNAKISLQDFERVISIGLNQYKLGIIPPSLDQVMVGSIERSKSHQIKALYIMGVNDGVFPAASGKEGILLDSERESLAAMGVEIAPTTKARAFEEKYLIYKSLTIPSQYLKISYPIADNEGKSLRPSIIISRLKKLFPNITQYSNIIKTGDLEEELRSIASADSTFNELLASIRRDSDGQQTHPLWWEVYKWYLSQEQWKQKCDRALSALFYTNKVDYIRIDRAKKLYGSPVRSSVSKLEKYVSCPFSYFVQYGLKAKERKIYKLSSPDLGTFFHEVIDRFSKDIAKDNILWRNLERSQCQDIISKIVDEIIEEMSISILKSSPRYQYLTDRLKRVLTRAVWIIAQHIKRSGFEPLGYEVGFGDREKLPPISLQLPDGEVIKLEGRIDRVDTLKTNEGTYLRIIDYKSGNKAFKLSDVYYGLQIQLISYLDALANQGIVDVAKDVIPGGILYFKIDDPIIRGGKKHSEEEIERSIIKQLKMKGLLLADVKIIREMDREIDGDSIIIPARINKDGNLGRSSAATIEQFELLRNHVKNLLSNLSQEMLKGDVSINPYKKKGFTSCAYCSYSSICQFDTSFRDNKYRVIEDRKDEEVWDLIKANVKTGGEE